MLKTEIDWSKAPEGATHVAAQIGGSLYYNCYKQEDGEWYYCHDGGDWSKSTNALSNWFSPIPKEDLLEVKKPEWKIKHIKSPNYTTKKDAATTIVYRDLGDRYIEYKVAFCNPSDNFSRKLGVATAKSKEPRKIYVGKHDPVVVILTHLQFVEPLSNEVYKVLDYYFNQYL